jgi:hypothetical protein
MLDRRLTQGRLAVGEHRPAGGDQLAGVRVDEEVFLLDAEGEVVFRQHRS